MIPALSGVVVHPWMTRKADDIAWLAWAIREKRDRLEEAMARAGDALRGDPESASPPVEVPETAGLHTALTRISDALDTLAAAIAEHGTAIERDRAELVSTSPHQVARLARLRHRIRRATDALSEADVACRRALEQALREVPSSYGIAEDRPGGWAAVFGVPQEQPGSGAEATGADGRAPSRRLGSILRAARPDSSPREALRTLPTPTMARHLAASPELRVRLADDLPKLSDEPALDVTNLAQAAGVDPRLAHGAAEVLRRRGPRVRDLAAVGDDQGGAVEAARIAAIAEAFAQLGDDAATRLALLWPRLVGDLDGAPLHARVLANRALLRAELESARRSEAELEARSVARRLADEPFVVRRLRTAVSVAYARREWLTSLVSLSVDEPLVVRDDLRTRIRLYLRLLTERSTWPGAGEPQPRGLMVFDPNGRGRIVEVVGCWGPGTENLVVMVPGTGTGMPGYHLPAATAHDLVRADESGRTAAVCWMGVDFPAALVNEAVLAHYARAAGPALTSTLLALDVPPNVAVTVVGHSYGSSVVGAAEVAGLPADRVVHLASPGAGPGVRSVRDYARTDPLGRIRSVRRYACTAPGDPVRLVRSVVPGWPVFLRPLALPAGWMRRRIEGAGVDLSALDAIGLGVDPARLEGVRLFEAGVWEVDTGRHKAGEPVAGRSGHAGVITSGSTAFRRLVEIVTGG